MMFEANFVAIGGECLPGVGDPFSKKQLSSG
jgi:hypothetical protein